MTENQLSTIIVDAAIEGHHELGGSGMERQGAKAQSFRRSAALVLQRRHPRLTPWATF